jgi:hypothetical protein
MNCCEAHEQSVKRNPVAEPSAKALATTRPTIRRFAQTSSRVPFGRRSARDLAEWTSASRGPLAEPVGTALQRVDVIRRLRLVGAVCTRVVDQRRIPAISTR